MASPAASRRSQTAESHDQTTSTNTSNTGTCMLLELAPEIRNNIYTYALQQSGSITIFGANGVAYLQSEPNHDLRKHKSSPLALTCTNKQIRHESLKLFYSCNHFTLRPDTLRALFEIPSLLPARPNPGRRPEDPYRSFDWIWSWIDNIGVAQAKVLSKVTIDFGGECVTTSNYQELRDRPHDVGAISSLLKKLLSFLRRNDTTCFVTLNVMPVIHAKYRESGEVYDKYIHIEPLVLSVTSWEDVHRQLATFIKTEQDRRWPVPAGGWAYDRSANVIQTGRLIKLLHLVEAMLDLVDSMAGGEMDLN